MSEPQKEQEQKQKRKSLAEIVGATFLEAVTKTSLVKNLSRKKTIRHKINKETELVEELPEQKEAVHSESSSESGGAPISVHSSDSDRDFAEKPLILRKQLNSKRSVITENFKEGSVSLEDLTPELASLRSKEKTKKPKRIRAKVRGSPQSAHQIRKQEQTMIREMAEYALHKFHLSKEDQNAAVAPLLSMTFGDACAALLRECRERETPLLHTDNPAVTAAEAATNPPRNPQRNPNSDPKNEVDEEDI